MIYERFFMVLAGMVLAAIAGGWLASHLRRVLHGLLACVAVAGALALAVLQLSRAADTQGFAALLVIGAFMFSLVIAASGSLVFRRLRQSRSGGQDGTAP